MAAPAGPRSLQREASRRELEPDPIDGDERALFLPVESGPLRLTVRIRKETCRASLST